MKFALGQAVTRLEDQRLLTGGGRYTDDLNVAGQAYGFVVRSPHAAARIAAIDSAAARAAPGVLAVFTGADAAAAGLGDLPCLIPLESRDGTPRADTPHPVLASERVRHVGDPVAFVVAESLDQARDAAELLAVDYEALPAVADAIAALAEGAPAVHAHVPGNLCFDWENGDEAAVDAAFARAAHVSHVELVNNRVVVASMEPRAALADYDATSDRSTLTTSTQGLLFLHGPLAEQVLGIGTDKLRVVTPDVGGAFGMKAFAYPEQALSVWASRQLGRAVKWTPDRSEAFVSDVQGRDHLSRLEAAFDREGRILALRANVHANLGAYLSSFVPFIATGATSMLCGLYRVPAVYVRVKGVLTNTVPVDAYRGAGRPEAAYAIERLIDVAARDLSLAPDEMRRRNFIAAAEMPYTTALGDVYDDGDFAAVMEKCMADADWAGFERRRAEAEARGRLRGIGMATYIERCGGGFPETAELRFGDDDTLTMALGTQDNGQGHTTSYTQVLSERLGIDAEAIRLVQGDSDRTPQGLTGGSRSLPVGAAALGGAADLVIDKGREVAANLLEAAAVDIEYGEGRFTVAGTDKSAGLFEVARAARDPANLPAGAEAGLDASYTREPEAPTYPNGCHICEVEVDPETGTVEVARYTVVDDFGAVVNPLLLAGQVHGGIVQGLGQALLEHTVYEPETAQLLSASFLDYAMPRADGMPSIAFSTLNRPCATNPYGLKGAGEAGAVGAPPAAISALVDALHARTGAVHIDMPATPERVWRALNG